MLEKEEATLGARSRKKCHSVPRDPLERRVKFGNGTFACLFIKKKKKEKERERIKEKKQRT